MAFTNTYTYVSELNFKSRSKIFGKVLQQNYINSYIQHIDKFVF